MNPVIFFLLYPIHFLIEVAWCVSMKSPNAPCNINDKLWYPIKGRPFEFLYCNLRTKVYETSKCHKINGIQSVFNFAANQCIVRRHSYSPGTAKSSNLGDLCTFNTDCYENMYCPLGKCTCLPGYIGYEGVCYVGISPEQTGCIIDPQCEVVWPGSTCERSTSTCRCTVNPGFPNIPRFPLVTKDGIVCVAAGSCPLPEGYYTPVSPSLLSPFLDLSDAQTRQMCTYLSSDTSSVRDNFCDIKKSLTPSVDEYVGDLYDCIPLDFTTSGARPGICCPSRALTCIQPQPAIATGTSVLGIPRYWYNSATGGCDPFLWDSTADNPPSANNFLTIDHCLSYCSNTCSRGSPEYTGIVDQSSLGKPRRCSSSGSCTNSGLQRYQCDRVGTNQYCCPSKDWICSNFGGRTYGFGVSAPSLFDEGDGPGGVVTPITRWYYDSSSGTCISFQYLQFGGNFNNFGSPEECQAFCETVCPQGAPLKDSMGIAQTCSSSFGCPSTYECQQNVCCPKMQTICSQPMTIGTCGGSMPRYWYNAISKDCEHFLYTGCGGNDNNFDSYPSCVDYCIQFEPKPKCIQGTADKDSSGKFYKCSSAFVSTPCRTGYECYYDGQVFGCCPTKFSTCSLQPAAGSRCKLPTARWYFNPLLNRCQTFTFYGCDGNSNNFQNKQQCESYCYSTGCPFGGNLYRDPVSSVTSTCDTRLKPCPSGFDCVLITVGLSSAHYCCPTRANICNQPLITGIECGLTVTQRFYFNGNTKQCQPFSFIGCGGNENNFVTLQQCNIFCGSIACSTGETALFNAQTKMPVSCSPQSSIDVCGSGHSCKFDSFRKSYYCCGSTLNGVCPSNERTYSDPFTGLPKECSEVLSVCPPNFLCRLSYERNRNYCCGSQMPNGILCPNGKALYKDELTSAPKQCTVTYINSCPIGYSCQSTVSTQFFGYCCSINSVCPNDGEFVVDQSSGNPLGCFSNGSTVICPSGSTCLYRVGAMNGFCCKTVNPPPAPSCPTGMSPLLEVDSKTPKSCTTNANCLSNNFNCYTNSPNATFTNGICCTNPGHCPQNSSPLLDSNNRTAVCPFGQSQCNVPGHICQAGSLGINICCSQQSDVPPLCPHGKPLTSLTCSKNADCPINYECIKSTGLPKVCCPSKLLVCSQTMNTGISCPTSLPSSRYYYNSLSGSCVQFTFNGCNGNDNNFATIEDCDAFCANGICDRGPPLRDGSLFKFCSTESCPTGYQCKKPLYGPSFWNICCQTSETVCRQPYNKGVECASGAGVDTRYYYNYSSKQCAPFIYLGCSGNDNNFESSEACSTYCNPPTKLTCPNNQPIWVDPVTKMAPVCTGQYRCPLFHRCIYIASGNDYYCCSPPTTSFGCPNGGSPFLYPNLNLPLACFVGSQCPHGFTCQRSSATNQWYCCPISSTNRQKI